VVSVMEAYAKSNELGITAVNDHATYDACLEVMLFEVATSSFLPIHKKRHILLPATTLTGLLYTNDEIRNAWRYIESALGEAFRLELDKQITEHKAKADKHFKSVDAKLHTIKLENIWRAIMKDLKDTAVEKVTFIFGVPVQDMSKEDLMIAIKRVKKDIVELQATDVESSYISAEVKRLEEQVLDLVKLLDKGC